MNNKKKIIFVTEALWIGGIETALINLLNSMDYQKYEVTLLVCRASLELRGRVNSKCKLIIADREEMISFNDAYPFARLYHLLEVPKNPSSLHKALMWTIPILRFFENKLYLKYIASHMKTQKYDTAVIYSDTVAETTIRSIRAKKYVMFYHHGAMRHVYHDKIAYQKCDKIIAVSDKQAEKLSDFVPSAAKKICSIHNLIDIDGIREKAKCNIEDKFDANFFNIVSVGRVSHEKGMDIAVRVCAELVNSGHKNIRWWIVGDGPAMGEVQEVISQTGMKNYIIPVGMKKNPYPYIKKADLYVQPSRFEGYPMTLLEALVLGQPVISTDNNGAKEIVESGITGILAPQDTKKLAEAVINILDNPNELILMRHNVESLDFYKKNEMYVRQLEKIL